MNNRDWIEDIVTVRVYNYQIEKRCHSYREESKNESIVTIE